MSGLRTRQHVSGDNTKGAALSRVLRERNKASEETPRAGGASPRWRFAKQRGLSSQSRDAERAVACAQNSSTRDPKNTRSETVSRQRRIRGVWCHSATPPRLARSAPSRAMGENLGENADLKFREGLVRDSGSTRKTQLTGALCPLKHMDCASPGSCLPTRSNLCPHAIVSQTRQAPCS